MTTTRLDLMLRGLGQLMCLTLLLSLGPSSADDIASYPTNAMMRENLRPKGDFREQVYAGIARLQVESSEEGRCNSANRFGHLFYWMSDAEQQAIEDDMIVEMSALLDRDTANDGGGCVSYVLGNIFMTIGPRAKAAVPSLERALKAAVLARSKAVELSPPKTLADCFMLGMNFDRKVDYALAQALESIDGREREGFILKCPMDGDPSR